jgi:hypothetical protein
MRWRPALLLLHLVVVALAACASGGGAPVLLPSPEPQLDPELGVPLGADLLSIEAAVPPRMDGKVDPAWEDAPALVAPLHHGLHGDDKAGSAEIRSFYDQERVYFLVRWQSKTPGGEQGATRNLLTIHWRLQDTGLVSGSATGSEGLACTVACHTATADGEGQLLGIRSETIPPGLNEDLPVGGGWADGEWIVEWSRPRLSDSPYDQHMTDADLSYRFFLKLFEDELGRPDAVSDLHTLRLSP